MATISLIVKVKSYDDGNKFRIDNVRQKSVEANAGDTLIFDQSDPSNANHPLRIGLYADASHKINGSAYATGVTVSGVPGSSGAQTSFTVSDSALHGTYFYYCAHHQGMGGLIHYGPEEQKYNLIDEGATMTDIEDGDTTSQIHKKILKYNTATANWDTLYNIPYTATSPHTNPWRLIGTDSREAGSYRILYGSKNLVDATSATTERYLSVIAAAPFFEAPEWLGENAPIDEEGRIWAVQTVHFHDASPMPSIDPFTYAAGAPIDLQALLSLSYPAATNYVILRNDELEGAGAPFAPHSFANPVAGYDVGIPSTYNFMEPVHNQIFNRFNKGFGETMTAFIVPPGWECTVYRMPNYNPIGSPSYVGNGARYVLSGATVIYTADRPETPSNVSQTNINFNFVGASSEGFNARGNMVMWANNGGSYFDSYWGPGSGYSYLFKKIAMPE